MENESQDLNRLYQKVQSGVSSSAERKLLARWLAGVNINAEPLNEQLVEQQRLKLKDRFYQQQEVAKRNKVRKLNQWLTAAAAILGLTIGVSWLFLSPKTPGKPLALMQTVTQTAARKVITLTDGSIITLNNSSELRYPAEFNGNTREVYLSGEAFFNIKHDSSKPFIVHTGQLAVQVLGTSFNVNSYRRELVSKVTVSTGKVGVILSGSSSNAIMLTPGQQLSFNRDSRTFTEKLVNPEDFSNWQKGTLTFKNEQLVTICKRLERWYGIKIQILTPALNSKRLSLKQHNESLATVLKLLSVAGGFKYSQKDQLVKIW